MGLFNKSKKRDYKNDESLENKVKNFRKGGNKKQQLEELRRYVGQDKDEISGDRKNVMKKDEDDEIIEATPEESQEQEDMLKKYIENRARKVENETIIKFIELTGKLAYYNKNPKEINDYDEYNATFEDVKNIREKIIREIYPDGMVDGELANGGNFKPLLDIFNNIGKIDSVKYEENKNIEVDYIRKINKEDIKKEISVEAKNEETNKLDSVKDKLADKTEDLVQKSKEIIIKVNVPKEYRQSKSSLVEKLEQMGNKAFLDNVLAYCYCKENNDISNANEIEKNIFNIVKNEMEPSIMWKLTDLRGYIDEGVLKNIKDTFTLKVDESDLKSNINLLMGGIVNPEHTIRSVKNIIIGMDSYKEVLTVAELDELEKMLKGIPDNIKNSFINIDYDKKISFEMCMEKINEIRESFDIRLQNTIDVKNEPLQNQLPIQERENHVLNVEENKNEGLQQPTQPVETTVKIEQLNIEDIKEETLSQEQQEKHINLEQSQIQGKTKPVLKVAVAAKPKQNNNITINVGIEKIKDEKELPENITVNNNRNLQSFGTVQYSGQPIDKSDYGISLKNTIPEKKVLQEHKKAVLPDCDKAIRKVELQKQALEIAQKYLSLEKNKGRNIEEINVVCTGDKFVLQEKCDGIMTNYDVDLKDVKFENERIANKRLDLKEPLSIQDKDLGNTIHNLSDCKDRLLETRDKLNNIVIEKINDAEIVLENGKQLVGDKRYDVRERIDEVKKINNGKNDKKYLDTVANIAYKYRARSQVLDKNNTLQVFEPTRNQNQDNNLTIGKNINGKTKLPV